MGYIGTKPTAAPLTSAQLEDGLVTAAKLATDAVETAKVKDLNVTVAKLPATVDISSKTVTLPASVAGLGTGITNAQLAGSIDVTSKITGTIPTANLGSGSASASTYLAGNQTYQTITEYNDDALQNDIATLALHQATNANAAKYNLTNTNVDVYQDSTGIATLTDCTRNEAGEYVDTTVTTTNETAYRYYKWVYTVPSANSNPKIYEWYVYSSLGSSSDLISWSGATATVVVGTEYGSSNGPGAIIDGDENTVLWYNVGTANIAYKVDFGVGNSETIQSVKFVEQQHIQTTAITLKGSQDNISYTDVNTWDGPNGTGTWDDAKTTYTMDVGTEAINATGNYVSTATTANASVSKVGIVITYKNQAGTNALNTDIIAQVSADGGSNYSTVTLVAAGTFSTGVLQAVANDVSVTAGTSIQYKISFANQAGTTKEARITGVSLIY